MFLIYTCKGQAYMYTFVCPYMRRLVPAIQFMHIHITYVYARMFVYMHGIHTIYYYFRIIPPKYFMHVHKYIYKQTNKTHAHTHTPTQIFQDWFYLRIRQPASTKTTGRSFPTVTLSLVNIKGRPQSRGTRPQVTVLTLRYVCMYVCMYATVCMCVCMHIYMFVVCVLSR